MTSIAPEAQEQVLSTLNRDGSRRWLTPKLSPGSFWRRRRVVAWGLIVLFSAVPHLRVGGKPLLLLDMLERQFVFFGRTFFATDTLLLLLAALALFFGLFLLTAAFGRVWCGWACPQTVYLEFLYRPLERFFKSLARRKKLSKGMSRWAKRGSYLLISMFLAHTFLAYFVGTERLATWMTGSPFQHPLAFAVVALVTAAMCFNFGFFREQTCLVACPYGRFQSVLLDRDSLIVGYDAERGEPRGKAKQEGLGDCVDCRLCVTTCPTGIDIRDGLQMECVHCTQCVDACNAVMTKLGRAPGLIRYSSQNELAQQKTRIVRPRVLIYGACLTLVSTLLAVQLLSNEGTDVFVMRSQGAPFQVLPSGSVTNSIRMKVSNRTPQVQRYTLSVEHPGVQLRVAQNPFEVAGDDKKTLSFFLEGERELFARGSVSIVIVLKSDDGFEFKQPWQLTGP